MVAAPEVSVLFAWQHTSPVSQDRSVVQVAYLANNADAIDIKRVMNVRI